MLINVIKIMCLLWMYVCVCVSEWVSGSVCEPSEKSNGKRAQAMGREQKKRTTSLELD